MNSKSLVFEPDDRKMHGPSSKTWKVFSSNRKENLGYIVWAGHTKGFSFEPQALTSFDAKNLKEIYFFCDERTIERKWKAVT